MPCGYETLSTTGVRIWHQVACRDVAEVSAALAVSRRPAQWSQQLHNLTILTHNLVAFWIHLHHYRCCEEYVRMLLQSLRPLWKAPGGAGSTWEYLEAVVRTTRGSGRFAYGFQTELHLAVWQANMANRHSSLPNDIIKRMKARATWMQNQSKSLGHCIACDSKRTLRLRNHEQCTS
jgi:hypothetical protein